MSEQLIYCRYCGAKLKRDSVGLRCPTKNCQWEHGLPDNEPGALRSRRRKSAQARAATDKGGE